MTLNIVLQIASLSERITVTSTGSPTPQAQLGATVTVFDSSDYQGTRDIQEGLRYVSGVQATQTGQAGGTTGLYVRGGGSDANKVLIDGIPVNDIGGNVEFANLASAAISQVEVLRGPNSALYGSDALSSVVSLTTPRGSTVHPLITYLVDGGNFATYRQEGSISGQLKRFDYFTDYARFASDNSVPDSKYHNGTFTGNLGWALSPTSSLRATVHHDQVASGTPGALQLYGIPTEAEQANEDAYFGVTWEDATIPKWDNLIRYGGVRLRSNYSQFGAAGTVESGYSLGAPVTIQGANGYAASGQARSTTAARRTLTTCRLVRTLTQPRRIKTSSMPNRIIGSIPISSGWLRFVTKMSVGIRSLRAQAIRSSAAITVTPSKFRAI